MSEWKEITEVTETTRLVVTADYGSENPLNWDDSQIFYKTDGGWRYGPHWAEYDFETLPAEAIGDGADYLSDSELEEALIKHCKRQGLAAKALTLLGYSQGDYTRGVYCWSPETYGDMSEALEAYFRGDVYCVELQRAVRYIRAAEDGTVNPEGSITEWETSDALGGCYLDQKYTAANVALDIFALTEAETAALKGKLDS